MQYCLLNCQFPVRAKQKNLEPSCFCSVSQICSMVGHNTSLPWLEYSEIFNQKSPNNLVCGNCPSGLIECESSLKESLMQPH